MSKYERDGYVLMGPPIDENTRLAVHYDGDGNAYPTVAVKGGEKETEGWVELEQCQAFGWDNVYRIKGKESRGPANWNSRSYCEGWERIFGGRAKEKKTDPSTLN